MPRNVRTFPSTLVVPSTMPASVFNCANAEGAAIARIVVSAQVIRVVLLCGMRLVLLAELKFGPTSFVNRQSSFVIRERQALRSGLGGDGRNASRVVISTRIASDSSDSATRRDNCAGSPMARALIIRSCHDAGDASSVPSTTGSAPAAHTL